jgi:hypothetical protein
MFSTRSTVPRAILGIGNGSSGMSMHSMRCPGLGSVCVSIRQYNRYRPKGATVFRPIGRNLSQDLDLENQIRLGNLIWKSRQENLTCFAVILVQ